MIHNPEKTCPLPGGGNTNNLYEKKYTEGQKKKRQAAKVAYRLANI